MTLCNTRNQKEVNARSIMVRTHAGLSHIALNIGEFEPTFEYQHANNQGFLLYVNVDQRFS